MIVALDIDGTITANPPFFATLSRAIIREGGKVLIVSSRANTYEVRCSTAAELVGYGIEYTELFLIDDIEAAAERCPHKDLNWWEKYLWQKVDICVRNKVGILFEDDAQVIDLMKKLTPDIQVFTVVK